MRRRASRPYPPSAGFCLATSDSSTACFAIAAEEGWVELESDRVRIVCVPTPVADSAPASFDERFSEFEADVRLLNHCGSQLAKVLRGDIDPLQVLFGAEADGLTERMYHDSPVALFYNGLLRDGLEKLLTNRSSDRPIRVLEIGAGTGGTTAHVLPLFSQQNCEYVFTDVSPFFLAQVRIKFKDFPFIQYHLLDLEKPPGSQGFADHPFDIVLAANVLHATSDLRRSLGHIRKLLVPAGLLLLLEGTRPTRVLDLTFGLTDGWWRLHGLLIAARLSAP